MFAKPPRRFIHSALALIAVAAIAFGTLGVSAASNSQRQDVAHPDKVCKGNQRAIEELVKVLEMDDLTPFEEEDIEAVIEKIEESIRLERDGQTDEAMELKMRIVNRLKDMAEEADEDDNERLAKELTKAARRLSECTDRPIRRPVPPAPRPVSQLVYSTKFVCGRVPHPDVSGADVYQTEINVHNFSNRSVALFEYAAHARPQDQPRGRVTERTKQVLGPYEALQVNCRNIQQMFGDIDHQVCPGKPRAIRIMNRLLDGAATSTPAVIRAEEVVDKLHEAVRLEEAGELQQAMELEEEIIEELNALIDIAVENDRPAVARALTRARNLVQRCLNVLIDDISSDGGPDFSGMAEGFLAIESPRQLEVTAVYRAKTHNADDSQDQDTGISIDVEQIEPHRLNRVHDVLARSDRAGGIIADRVVRIGRVNVEHDDDDDRDDDDDDDDDDD